MWNVEHRKNTKDTVSVSFAAKNKRDESNAANTSSLCCCCVHSCLCHNHEQVIPCPPSSPSPIHYWSTLSDVMAKAGKT